jgi:pimeloyl-ACP methyl ester carboxylesterase
MPYTEKRSVRRPSGLSLAALLVGAVGCQARPSRAPAAPTTTTPTPASATTPTSAPQPADQCGTPATRAQTFWLDGPGGDRLQAAMVGSGHDAAVFVHQSGTQGLCDFWPYAAWLAGARQVRAVLFDQCGYGASSCPGVGRNVDGDRWVAATKAAVAWTRAHGARRVTLVGASFGGIVALHAARSIRPPVDAVVDLSGELLRVGALAEAHPEIAELDCNPVKALPEGVVVVDARVRVEAASPPPPLAARRR